MSAFISELLEKGYLHGWANYRDDNSSSESGNARIFIPVRLSSEDNLPVVEMILDTGAPWNLISPQLAQIYSLDTIPGEPQKLHTRFGWLSGKLIRHQMWLIATSGNDIEITGAMFIPDENGCSEDIPSFLGYQGCFIHLKTIIDPMENAIGYARYDDY